MNICHYISRSAEATMEHSKESGLNELFCNNTRTRRSMIAAGGGALLTAGLARLGFLGVAWAQPAPAAMTLGQRIVTYAASHVGQCVADIKGAIRPGSCGPFWMPPAGTGPGECTHLAHSALVANGARPPNYNNPPHYTWGTRVQAPYQPGDIIELVDTRFDGPNGGWWETTSQHTAIIERTQGTVLHLLQQHSPERIVTRGNLDLGWRLSRGDYAVFRPIPA
jgi:hypothetical protein